MAAALGEQLKPCSRLVLLAGKEGVCPTDRIPWQYQATSSHSSSSWQFQLFYTNQKAHIAPSTWAALTTLLSLSTELRILLP